MVAHVEGGLIVFARARDVRLSRQHLQVRARRSSRGDGAKLLFKAALARSLFRREAVKGSSRVFRLDTLRARARPPEDKESNQQERQAMTTDRFHLIVSPSDRY